MRSLNVLIQKPVFFLENSPQEAASVLPCARGHRWCFSGRPAEWSQGALGRVNCAFWRACLPLSFTSLPLCLDDACTFTQHWHSQASEKEVGLPGRNRHLSALRPGSRHAHGALCARVHGKRTCIWWSHDRWTCPP